MKVGGLLLLILGGYECSPPLPAFNRPCTCHLPRMPFLQRPCLYKSRNTDLAFEIAVLDPTLIADTLHLDLLLLIELCLIILDQLEL